MIGRHLSSSGVRVHLVLPRLTRAECDLNRAPARATAFRSALRAAALGARLVLDVHSFAPRKGRIGTFVGDRPFVLLDLCAGGRASLATASAQSALRSSGWAVDTVSTRLGDIRAEMTERRTPVLSIEVNSELQLPLRHRLYCDIARWAASYIPM